MAVEGPMKYATVGLSVIAVFLSGFIASTFAAEQIR
jgi:hypothetical protein